MLARPLPEGEPRPPSKALSVSIGAGLGLLAGLTGTGGGIFLTPLVIFMGWARTKTAAAISACFILVNSIAGLLGGLSAVEGFPQLALPLAIAALCGGFSGSSLGSRQFPHTTLKQVLVLTLAGFKLLLT